VIFTNVYCIHAREIIGLFHIDEQEAILLEPTVLS